VRTTGRNLSRDFATEYAKRAQAKAALTSTSWHNDMLALSESIILNHAAALTSLRRHLNLSSNHGKDNSRWLHEVESFIDEVIEVSGCHIRSSADLLRAVRWMIAGATAQFSLSTVRAQSNRLRML
jgi:aspartyl/asparaginyl beta-hydroxylase (cupin superfamily)